MNAALRMRTERCRVCGQDSHFVFELPVLGRAVGYFECPACRYLQTQAPDWLAEAYAKPINDVDTGIMARNQLNVRRVIMTLLAYGRPDGRVIDHAGGYGILVRLLRDAGIEARWADKYCSNLLARGFEADANAYDLLTAFEVLEHMVDPAAEIEAMLRTAPIVLASTDLIPTPHTPPTDWWYLGTEHGQHVGFFRLQTFRTLAARLDCHFASDGRSLHVFSRAPVPARWRVLQRLASLAPLVVRFKLQSKTGSDFAALRDRREDR